MVNHVSFPGLGLEMEINRVAFTVFGVPIYWYGVCIALGLLLGMLYAFRYAKSYGIDADRMVDVIFASTIAAIIGGRAYYVATAPFEYQSIWEMIDIRLGGIAIYGGIIAAFAMGALMCRVRKVPMLPMFDLAAQGFLIGQCLGRWGNFFKSGGIRGKYDASVGDDQRKHPAIFAGGSRNAGGAGHDGRPVHAGTSYVLV